ncbi:hypothetical protein B0J11DRAFT_19796 [Dendryphion nanum]|uniref:RING-type domain-containing protein n=1 Tax=Dendryphion nanum TaxID=256645 RepID=A0A9P9IYK5_9PLEO|nr:hypothetical protein B0J11DRAFT_19796 [Dendryphion nanum]
MGNEEAGETELRKQGSIAIAIILPSVFAIILVALIAIAIILPRYSGIRNPESKEDRMKKRIAALDDKVKAQHFEEWAKKHRVEQGEACSTKNPLCVICLDEIEDAAQIRGLGCLHVFHQECLDDWFARWNEYCPLCHRPIVEGTIPIRRRSSEPPPIPFMV